MLFVLQYKIESVYCKPSHWLTAFYFLYTNIACEGCKKQSSHSGLYIQITLKHLWQGTAWGSLGIRGRINPPSKVDFCKTCSKSLLCLGVYFTWVGSVNIFCTSFLLRWVGGGRGSCLLLTNNPPAPVVKTASSAVPMPSSYPEICARLWCDSYNQNK